jgi:hypothetical protein
MKHQIAWSGPKNRKNQKSPNERESEVLKTEKKTKLKLYYKKMHFSFISNWNWKREEIRKKYWF